MLQIGLFLIKHKIKSLHYSKTKQRQMSSWIPNFSQTALLILSPLLLLLLSSKRCSTVCKSIGSSLPPFPSCLQSNHCFFHFWCLQPFWTPFSLHRNSDFTRPSQAVSLHLCNIRKSITTILSSYLPQNRSHSLS